MTDDLVERLRKQAYFADRSAEDAFNEAAGRIEALEAENERLREVATALRDDMLRRAKMNAWQRDGDIVVEAGAGVWSRFCAALGEKQ